MDKILKILMVKKSNASVLSIRRLMTVDCQSRVLTFGYGKSYFKKNLLEE